MVGYFIIMKRESKIVISRGEHQFASAHFLVDMGKCERLHGHNYNVRVELGGEAGEDDTIIDFNTINPIIKEICDGLDHKIIIAENSPRHTLEIGDAEIEVKFKSKRFVFPRSDCMILPIKATTVERLSVYLVDLIAQKLGALGANIEWIEAGVSEGGAQLAAHRRSME